MVRLLTLRRGVAMCGLILAGCLGWATGFLPGRAQAAAVTQAEATDGKMAARIETDEERYQELFQRGELERAAKLMLTNMANPQFTLTERKAYAFGMEYWLRSQFASIYETLDRQRQTDGVFPVARLRSLMDQFEVVYRTLEELAPQDLDMWQRQLERSEQVLLLYRGARDQERLKQEQARVVRIGQKVTTHPEARWNERVLILHMLEKYAEQPAAVADGVHTLMAQPAKLGVNTAEDWARLAWSINCVGARDLFRTTALTCYETALATLPTNAPGRFDLHETVAAELKSVLQFNIKNGDWTTNATPPESFTRDHQRVVGILEALPRAYPVGSAEAKALRESGQQLNFALATEITDKVDYVALNRSQMGDVIGYLFDLKSGAPPDQAARFKELIADTQMRRVEGLTKRTEASVLADDEAETRYKLACADAPKDRLSYYESIYKSYLAHAGKLKEVEAEKRRERARQEPAKDEWVPAFQYQDPRLIDKPAATTAAPASGGNQSGSAAPAQSTSRYCMTCNGTGSRTVWEDAYDSYSRKWGRQQVRKSCDRCGGKGTLP